MHSRRRTRLRSFGAVARLRRPEPVTKNNPAIRRGMPGVRDVDLEVTSVSHFFFAASPFLAVAAAFFLPLVGAG